MGLVYLPTFTINVGKYPSPMDPMGYGTTPKKKDTENLAANFGVEASAYVRPDKANRGFWKVERFINQGPINNNDRILEGPGMVIPLIFPKVPQSCLGILRVPQLPPPLGHPPLKNPTKQNTRNY